MISPFVFGPQQAPHSLPFVLVLLNWCFSLGIIWILSLSVPRSQ